MKKIFLFGLSTISILFTGCINNTKQSIIERPKSIITKDVKSFVLDSFPPCPKYSKIMISSEKRAFDYIKSVDKSTKENEEKVDINIGTNEFETITFFSGCKNKDGSFSLEIINEKHEQN